MPVETPKVVAPPPPSDRRPMVGWFDPGPLLSTGLNVLVSTLFGRHSDYRLLEALAAGGGDEIHDYTKEGDALRESHPTTNPVQRGAVGSSLRGATRKGPRARSLPLGDEATPAHHYPPPSGRARCLL